eukprot:scaffold133_cov407-Prasinococcus_capsulatus_cf.AAC.23
MCSPQASTKATRQFHVDLAMIQPRQVDSTLVFATQRRKLAPWVRKACDTAARSSVPFHLRTNTLAAPSESPQHPATSDGHRPRGLARPCSETVSSLGAGIDRPARSARRVDGEAAGVGRFAVFATVFVGC